MSKSKRLEEEDLDAGRRADRLSLAPPPRTLPPTMSSSSLTTVDRVYVKRTRRGQVKTHVRQQYLRDDLPTGSPHLDGALVLYTPPPEAVAEDIKPQ